MAGRGNSTSLIEVADLRKHYPLTKGVVLRRSVGQVHAVDGIAFSVQPGEVLGLVGETGCGKSTTGRIVAGYTPPTAGTITINGRTVADDREGRRTLQKSVQLISQDPFSSLNPRQSIGVILSAPYRYQRLSPEGGVRKAVYSLLEQVGLSRADYHRVPGEFSGGQRQRVAIARAIALRPQLIVADEPVSALDVSIRAQILNLLEDLRRQYGTAYLFISHDLSAVRHGASQIAVMYLGKIVELAPSDALFAEPRHPYTLALLSAAPIPDPRLKLRERVKLRGEVPSPVNPPTGCRFHTRCWKATELCRTIEPPLARRAPNHFVACHFPESEPTCRTDVALVGQAQT